MSSGSITSLSEKEWSSHDSAYADGFHNLKRAGVDDLKPSLNARVEILTVRIWGDVSVQRWLRLKRNRSHHLQCGCVYDDDLRILGSKEEIVLSVRRELVPHREEVQRDALDDRPRAQVHEAD